MSNQDHTMMLHTYTPQPMSLPSINFLHLIAFLKILLGNPQDSMTSYMTSNMNIIILMSSICKFGLLIEYYWETPTIYMASHVIKV